MSTNQQTMEALLELSGFPRGQYVDRMVRLIARAPDPETACRVITNEFQATGALERQWRKVIKQTWQSEHQGQAYPLDVPLTSEDVLETDALSDVRRLLDELFRRPASLVHQGKEYAFSPDELPRLTDAVPSLRRLNLPDVLEDEWACVPLRRLRLLLQALKLVRPYRGTLQVVTSRYRRFLSLPLPQQFYVLWHVDVYHMPWSHFTEGWEPYVDVVQEYVSLVWDVAYGTRSGHTQTVADLTWGLMDLYQTLWEQEGVAAGNHPETFLGLYEEYALPGVVAQLVIHDVLARYGLVGVHEGLPALIGSGSNRMLDSGNVSVRWTDIGEAMLAAERSGHLPCGLEMMA